MKEDYKMDTTKMWDYRVVRRESEDGSDEEREENLRKN